MKELSDIFDVVYGNKFDLNKMKRLSREQGGVNFVGRSARRHGVSGTVAPLVKTKPYPAGLITVALGGTPLASFVQRRPFYTVQNVAVLKPKVDLTFSEKLFVCMCIRHNCFRYSAFGREANRTLRALLIPERSSFPDWLVSPVLIAEVVAADFDALQMDLEGKIEYSGQSHLVGELFEIQYGNSCELCNLRSAPKGINFVSRRTGNNGVSARVAPTEEEPFPEGRLTVALSGQGGALQTYVQPKPFYTGFHVAVLTPKRPMPISVKLFYARALTLNRFRYGFGRQANRTLPAIQLPTIPPWVLAFDISQAKQAIASEIRRVFQSELS